ncbi:MAG: segregation/condensation protein A [candidate division Zixibacteria bacterium]|nr:segregation/condensation protein A [candidate division Zixibacteria bacterium]
MTGNNRSSINLVNISEDLRGYGTQPFEGPLDLLLYLIKQDEVDIYDIPIAEITKQYLTFLEAMKELNLEVAGEFILMAAMLIRLKTQMLLPEVGGDETEIDDPRNELIEALLEYKKYKQAAEELGERGKEWSKRFKRHDFPEVVEPEVCYVLRKIDMTSLMIAFADVMERAKKETVHQVAADEVYIEDRIRHITEMLSDSDKLEFYKLFEDDPRRIVIVVTFAALLELVRLNQISLRQSSTFGKIWVYPINLQVEEAIRLYAETH